MIQYIKNVLIWLDQGVNVIVFCGYPDQTLSARAWRHAKNGQRIWLQKLNDTSTEHPQEWKKYVFMMSKHKLMERLQEFCKDDYPSSSDYKTVKEVSEALYYIMCCQKAMMAR